MIWQWYANLEIARNAPWIASAALALGSSYSAFITGFNLLYIDQLIGRYTPKKLVANLTLHWGFLWVEILHCSMKNCHHLLIQSCMILSKHDWLQNLPWIIDLFDDHGSPYSIPKTSFRSLTQQLHHSTRRPNGGRVWGNQRKHWLRDWSFGKYSDGRFCRLTLERKRRAIFHELRHHTLKYCIWSKRNTQKLMLGKSWD